MKREELLAAARAAVMERGQAYGPPGPFYARLARLWSVILDREVSAVEVVLCLDALKTARLLVNPGHVDSIVDKAGYAACLAEVAGTRGADGGTPDRDESQVGAKRETP